MQRLSVRSGCIPLFARSREASLFEKPHLIRSIRRAGRPDTRKRRQARNLRSPRRPHAARLWPRCLFLGPCLTVPRAAEHGTGRQSSPKAPAPERHPLEATGFLGDSLWPTHRASL